MISLKELEQAALALPGDYIDSWCMSSSFTEFGMKSALIVSVGIRRLRKRILL